MAVGLLVLALVILTGQFLSANLGSSWPLLLSSFLSLLFVTAIRLGRILKRRFFPKPFMQIRIYWLKGESA